MLRRPGLRTSAARLGLSALAALVAAGACSPRRAIVPDVPPETTLFVQGPLSTVNHIVHLYWFGSDPDGEVAYFELRFKNPALPADTQWVRTTQTDSVFSVFTPTGFTAPKFEVRAVDDHGLTDPTPATNDFSFSNQPPTVHFALVPNANDTTYATATLSWQATDPDGDPGRMQFLVYLDSLGSRPVDPVALPNTHLVSGSGFTVPTADFRVGGALQSGYRVVFLQPIDDGGRVGNVDSSRFFVRSPGTGGLTHDARLLIVDDVPTTNPANPSTDSLFANAAVRAGLAPASVSLLRLQSTQPFQSAKDLEQTFKLFDAVIWYRGTQTNFSVTLLNHQDGIGPYLESGGKFFLEGLDLFSGPFSTGPIREDFVSRYLDSRLLQNLGSGGDSTTTWGIAAPRVVRTPEPSLDLKFAASYTGLRAFLPADSSEVELWARAGTLAPPNPIDVAVGLNVPQTGGGRAIVVTFPLRGANAAFTVPAYLDRVFQELGLGP